jgi:hypothetical protein
MLILLVFITILFYPNTCFACSECFFVRIGGAKFVRPLYAKLQVADFHNEVNAIYTKGRATYHACLTVQLHISLANVMVELMKPRLSG